MSAGRWHLDRWPMVLDDDPRTVILRRASVAVAPLVLVLPVVLLTWLVSASPIAAVVTVASLLVLGLGAHILRHFMLVPDRITDVYRLVTVVAKVLGARRDLERRARADAGDIDAARQAEPGADE